MLFSKKPYAKIHLEKIEDIVFPSTNDIYRRKRRNPTGTEGAEDTILEMERQTSGLENVEMFQRTMQDSNPLSQNIVDHTKIARAVQAEYAVPKPRIPQVILRKIKIPKTVKK
jgi:hypothetical protein